MGILWEIMIILRRTGKSKYGFGKEKWGQWEMGNGGGTWCKMEFYTIRKLH